MSRSRWNVLAVCFPVVLLTAPVAAWEPDVARAPSSRPRLPLTLVDFAGLPGEVVSSVGDEIALLATTLGVEAELRAVPPGAVVDAGALTVILMNGPAPATLTPGVMGAVQRQGTTPALWIYPASVAAGARLRWEERPRWSDRQRSAFATALARVAVHEIVHVVCPGRVHDADGLMAGRLDAKALTQARPRVPLGLRRDFTAGLDAWGGAALRVAQRAGLPR
jgi:hypothetical protein